MAAKMKQLRGPFLEVSGFSRGLTKVWSNMIYLSREAYIFGNTENQASLLSRKGVHSSVYEKNEDPGVEMDRVPETVIIQPETQKSPWAPHPKTGVFVPPEELNGIGSDDHHYDEKKKGESVLEQHAWFRPLEDVQKQPDN